MACVTPITNTELLKIKNQVTVSANAMLKAVNENSFDEKAKEKLIFALIHDFQKSTQRILDEAISKKWR